MQLDDAFDFKHEISGDIYYATLLHEHPELINNCCELINSEWKRSLAASLNYERNSCRLRSISGSSNNFPTSVLLLKESKKPEVIGHCKLSKISRSSPVIFVDTVVIHPKFRGKGLGRLLMRKAEKFVKSKGIQWLYLSTMGQELFYEKLGYSFCQPINIYGGQLNYSFSPTEKDALILQENTVPNEQHTEKEKSCRASLSTVLEETMGVPPPPPTPFPATSLLPPPPPPPPPMSSSGIDVINMKNKKTYMRKKIS